VRNTACVKETTQLKIFGVSFFLSEKMDREEDGEIWVKPEWMRCIDHNDHAGLSRAVVSPSFDFDQLTPVMMVCCMIEWTRERYTPLGYALRTRVYWAFEILLEAGANPDSECVKYIKDDYAKEKNFDRPRRPIECCLDSYITSEFLERLITYCPTTLFDVQWPRRSFAEFLKNGNVLKTRVDVCLCMNARELRAYTAVWCANHAGGCWPDMAMLMQSVIMRDDITETPQKQRRTYLK
jgi:hypothetical protein